MHHKKNESYSLFSRDLLRLNVGQNSLNEIPSQALGPLKNLNQLDLSFNKIKDIKEDTFTGKYLCNRYENDVYGILGMEKLDTLNLNHNKIEALLDNHFEGMPKVTSLSLDYNKISDIAPDAFNGLEGKKCLKSPDCLEKCQIVSEQLQFLSLAANKISFVPTSALRPLHQLNTLHLNDNNITR